VRERRPQPKTHIAKISAREPKNIIVRHPSVRLFWNPLNIKKNKPINTAIRTMARIIPPAIVSTVFASNLELNGTSPYITSRLVVPILVVARLIHKGVKL
jgi:hypothetical protein